MDLASWKIPSNPNNVVISFRESNDTANAVLIKAMEKEPYAKHHHTNQLIKHRQQLHPYPSSSCSFVVLFPATQAPFTLWYDGAIFSDWAQNLTALYGLKWSCKEFFESHY